MLPTRILRVDDDPEARDVIARALERLLAERSFDLIIPDDWMGSGPTGVDLLRFAQVAVPGPRACS